MGAVVGELIISHDYKSHKKRFLGGTASSKSHPANAPSRRIRTPSAQLQPVALVQDQVLFEVGARIAGGYFVNTGLVSCLTVMRTETV